MNTQRQSGRVAIKIDNIENKTNNFNQSEDSKNTKFIYCVIPLNRKRASRFHTKEGRTNTPLN